MPSSGHSHSNFMIRSIKVRKSFFSTRVSPVRFTVYFPKMQKKILVPISRSSLGTAVVRPLLPNHSAHASPGNLGDPVGLCDRRLLCEGPMHAPQLAGKSQTKALIKAKFGHRLHESWTNHQVWFTLGRIWHHPITKSYWSYSGLPFIDSAQCTNLLLRKSLLWQLTAIWLSAIFTV